ncbi:hypothetical protein GCM10009610_34320 [Pseudonocardia xinjiangensis]
MLQSAGGSWSARHAYAFVYLLAMRPPEVLSFREFRAGLAATLKRVQSPGNGPVFVGAHRRPEAVVMSVSQYEELVAAAERRDAVTEALASVRAEGLEPGPEVLGMFTALAAGAMSTDELREQVLARYPQ